MLLCFVVACGRIRFDATTDANTSDGGTLLAPYTITVTVVGNGVVTSDPANIISCGTTCVASDLEIPITLAATPAGALTIDWQGVPCTGFSCDLDTDAEITVTFGAPTTAVNRVFITSAEYPGDIQLAGFADGLAAADGICQMTATNAGLDGTFVAFLSSSTTGRNAVDALAGSSGWADLGGRSIYGPVSDITTQRQRTWLDHDETGSYLFTTYWGGGGPDGRVSANTDCAAFTSTAVVSGVTYLTINITPPSYFPLSPCNAVVNLPCFEIGKQYTLPPFPIGRYLFISSVPIAGDAGLPFADMQCQADADAAGLPGGYRALLATSTTSVSDHLGGLAGPWRRPDGALVTFGSLGNVIDGAPTTLATGQLSSTLATWIGSSTLTDPGGGTCSDWTSTAGMAAENNWGELDLTWFNGGIAACTELNLFFCGQL